MYGREPTGELVLLGEPDLVAEQRSQSDFSDWGPDQGSLALAEPRAIHEVILDPDQLERYKQQRDR
ncbi:MAG: hypothetical protein EA424_05335 [Planctomycetaceae bacterium]|nr:MAG: hypothetical protein EA424_05335 [Planctomycetaceae bacterium]